MYFKYVFVWIRKCIYILKPPLLAGFHIGKIDFISNVLLQGLTSSFAGSANQGANHCEQTGEGGAHN